MGKKISYKLILLALLVWLLPNLVRAAEVELYLDPASGSYAQGDIFPISISLKSEENINAAQAVLKLPVDFLSLESISKQGSIFSLWPKQPQLTGARIDFAAGLPQPGFSGDRGNVLTIYVKAVAPGTARVNFVSGSVHANDGQGTNILDNMIGGTYTILPAAISPPAPSLGLPQVPVITSWTHPNENNWYQESEAVLVWQLPAGVDGLSFLFNDKPDVVPAEIAVSATTSAVFSGLDSGVWYFHLRFKNQKGWGPVSHFRVMVDKLPPEPFTITVDSDSLTELKPKIYFSAFDQHSGIDHYEIVIDKGKPYITTAQEYRLAGLFEGHHQVAVTAVDKAGNKRTAKAEVEVESLPVKFKIAVSKLGLNQLFIFYYLLIGLLLLLLLLLLWLWHKRQDKKGEKEMSQELDELSESVDFGFTTLRRDILSEIDLIRERQKTQGLTPQEEERLKKLKVDLDVVEGYVRKELRDVTELRDKKRGKRYHSSRRRF